VESFAGLSIGDFSQITHLSVRRCAATTRPGCCSPPRSTRTPANRYYATTQVPTAQVIRRFRELGMPVREGRSKCSPPPTRRPAAPLIAARP